MEIILNGEKEVLDQESTVLQLLQKFEMSPDIVTVNVNGEIIARNAFAEVLIKNGDTVDLLMFMGGGR